MAAKKAAAKKRSASGSARKSVKKVASKSVPARAGTKAAASKKVPRKKPPAKKTVTSAKTPTSKKTPPKKASVPHEVSEPAGHPPIAKATAAPNAAAPAPSEPQATPVAKPRAGSVLSGPVRGFSPYQPKRGEEYMSPEQLEHFRQILLAWKRELMEEVDRTMLHMKDDAANFPDPNDRATQESEFGLELRTRDRERKLLKKIDSALARIDDGSYGYCEETGDEIGLRRLEARPVATLCVEAQERRELAERQFRDREDQYR